MTDRLAIPVVVLAALFAASVGFHQARAVDVTPTDPLLPREPGPYAPAFVEAEDGTLDAQALSRVTDCATCHEEQVADWSSSAHGWASFDNPWYRFSVDAFREDAGNEASRFCGSCHDPALLADNGMDGEVSPENLLVHAGVACLACHGTRRTTPDGNGSYVVSDAAVPIPVDGDPESLRAHIARLATTDLVGDSLCVSCHRGFLGPEMGTPHYLVGMDDATDWRRSAWAGAPVERYDSVPERGCIDCHMRDHGAGSHRFPGAHTQLADALGDDEQLLATRAMLRSAVRVEIARATFDAPKSLLIDVVVANVGAGHSFPGGTRDLQDTWLEIEVADSSGAIVASAGTQHAETGADDTAHRFVAHPVNQGGGFEPFHVVSHFSTIAWNTTIPSRDARVVRYRAALPAAAGTQLSVRARLRHRRHHTRFSEAVCAQSRGPRAVAFAASNVAAGRPVVDPCAPPPITDLADVTTALDAPPSDDWEAHYYYALGLSHAQQELVSEALPPLHLADERAEGVHDAARIESLRGAIATRLGRTDEALYLLSGAEALVGLDPIVYFLFGEANASGWRWADSLPYYEWAATQSPDSDVAWAALASASNSDGEHAAALRASRRGLALQPRHPGLLLNQWLAMAALGAAPDELAGARDAYERHREHDGAPGARYACFRDDPACARERLPVHVHELRVVTPD